MAFLFSVAAVGLEPKRPVMDAPLVLDPRVHDCANIQWSVAYTLFAVCMYVCMYVGTYVRTYVRTYACMHACMHVCVYAVSYCMCIYIYTRSYVYTTYYHFYAYIFIILCTYTYVHTSVIICTYHLHPSSYDSKAGFIFRWMSQLRRREQYVSFTLITSITLTLTLTWLSLEWPKQKVPGVRTTCSATRHRWFTYEHCIVLYSTHSLEKYQRYTAPKVRDLMWKATAWRSHPTFLLPT